MRSNMANKRKIRYLPCTTICHGRCEHVLVSQIQNKNRIPLNPVCDKNGKKSIMINTLNDYLKSHYEIREVYVKANKEVINYDNKQMFGHKIFSIMDKDDTPDKMFEDYKTKRLFTSYWWGKEGYIEPIYFYPDMDAVFTRHGFPIDRRREKPAQYLKYLSVDYDNVIKMLMSLPKSESNISVFIQYVIECKKSK